MSVVKGAKLSRLKQERRLSDGPEIIGFGCLTVCATATKHIARMSDSDVRSDGENDGSFSKETYYGLHDYLGSDDKLALKRLLEDMASLGDSDSASSSASFLYTINATGYSYRRPIQLQAKQGS